MFTASYLIISLVILLELIVLIEGGRLNPVVEV